MDLEVGVDWGFVGFFGFMMFEFIFKSIDKGELNRIIGSCWKFVLEL